MGTERRAEFAGRFYPAGRAECEAMLAGLLEGVEVRPARGAIVPHAGWIYSGATAARGVACVAAGRPETVVLFGSVHVRTLREAALFDSGVWHTPLGPVAVDGELAGRLVGSEHIEVDAGAHRYEHSIEVELPLVQKLLPAAKIVPIMVRPGPWAEQVGRRCGEAAAKCGRRVGFVGSTDLTHYGPAFGFEPHGRGEAGLRWAREVNDRRLIELIGRMDAGGVVAAAAVERSACGAGAVAATIGAMLELGVRRYEELAHTTSAEYERSQRLEPVNSVGYEAGIFVEGA